MSNNDRIESSPKNWIQELADLKGQRVNILGSLWHLLNFVIMAQSSNTQYIRVSSNI